MGKDRDLLKSIRDSKGTFHAKMGLIKDRNGRNLTEAEDIKKRLQEYTEELRYKKVLMTWITMVVWSLTWSQTPWRVKSGLSNGSSVCSVTSVVSTSLWPHGLPGSSVHGILQAGILEWVAGPSSKGSSWPRDWTHVSCIAGGFFMAEPPGKPGRKHYYEQS